MKRIVICTLILALALGFAGCSSRAAGPEREAVAVVLSGASGSRTDASAGKKDVSAGQTDAFAGMAAVTDGDAQPVGPAAAGGGAPPVSFAAPAKADSSGWGKSWYGWWHTENCTGKYAEVWEGTRFDLCAEISDGWMFLWDQYSPRDDALAEFAFETGGSAGSAVNGMGFYKDMLVLGGELSFTADGDALRFRGRYKTDTGSFDFDGVLRPWGDAWEGVPAGEMPATYQEWYLPLIQSGVTEPPASFQE